MCLPFIDYGFLIFYLTICPFLAIKISSSSTIIIAAELCALVLFTQLQSLGLRIPEDCSTCYHFPFITFFFSFLSSLSAASPASIPR